MICRLTLIAAISAAVGAGAAFAEWRAEAVDAKAYPIEIVAETRAPVASVSENGLPDGLVETGAGDVAAAWYEAPTRRYAHAILGDGIEAGALVLRGADGRDAVLELPAHQVFEDRYPRIADLDGDGLSEVIAIRASRSGGGGLVVYGLREGRVAELAAVPDIGRPNRWLNVAAIADLDGEPGLEIAFVKTPHIGGTLRVFSWRDGALVLLDEMWGFSNHVIGAREMRLSALADIDGDGALEIALPSAGRRALRAMSAQGGALREVASVDLPAPINKAILFDAGGFVVGLDNGDVLRVAP